MFRRKLATTGQHEEHGHILYTGAPASSQTGALAAPWSNNSLNRIITIPHTQKKKTYNLTLMRVHATIVAVRNQ